MAITLFDKHDFRGESLVVSQDIDDLTNTAVGNRTSSMRLTSSNDVALFFRRKGWHGEAMFRRGPLDIENAGRPSKGGKTGFGNDIRSVRLTPFRLRFHFHIVKTTSDQFPGDLPDRAAVDSYLEGVLTEANSIWQPFLLQYFLIDTRELTSDAFFDLAGRAGFMRLAVSKKANAQGAALNVYFVNSVGRPGGISLPRVFTNRLAVEFFEDTFPEVTGLTLAHETGHFLGLAHRRLDTTNLMRPEPTVGPDNAFSNKALKDHQVEEAHQVLARNTESQRGVRAD